MNPTDPLLTDPEREALGAALVRSRFIRMSGGAGFGCISWLLAGGLLTVALGSTWNQADPNLPLVNWPLVATGWVAVVVAVGAGAVYLRRLVRFFHDVRTWSVAEVRHRMQVFSPPSGLESRLSSLSVQDGAGPSVVWALGAALIPPCGMVAAPTTVLVVGIMISDARSGQLALSELDKIELVVAAVTSLFVTSIIVVVAAGFQNAARRLRRLNASL